MIDGGAGTDTAIVGTGATYTPNGTSWTVTSSDGIDTLVGIEIVDDGAGPEHPAGRLGRLRHHPGGGRRRPGRRHHPGRGRHLCRAGRRRRHRQSDDPRRRRRARSRSRRRPTWSRPRRSASDREIHAVLTVIDSERRDRQCRHRRRRRRQHRRRGRRRRPGQFLRRLLPQFVGHAARCRRRPACAIPIRAAPRGGETLVSGVQRGVGVVVDNDRPLAFTMTGGSISDFQKNAHRRSTVPTSTSPASRSPAAAPRRSSPRTASRSPTRPARSPATRSPPSAMPARPTPIPGAILAFGNTDLNIQNNVITGSNDDSLDAKVVGIYISSRAPPTAAARSPATRSRYVDTGIGVYDDITPERILIENNESPISTPTDPVRGGSRFRAEPGAHNAPTTSTARPPTTSCSAARATTRSPGLGGDDRLQRQWRRRHSGRRRQHRHRDLCRHRAATIRSSPSPTPAACHRLHLGHRQRCRQWRRGRRHADQHRDAGVRRRHARTPPAGSSCSTRRQPGRDVRHHPGGGQRGAATTTRSGPRPARTTSVIVDKST